VWGQKLYQVRNLVKVQAGAGPVAVTSAIPIEQEIDSLSDDAVDALLEGKVGDFDTAFTRHCQGGGQPFLVLSSAMRQLQAIQAMRGQMDSGGRNAASVVAVPSTAPIVIAQGAPPVDRIRS